MMNKKVIAVALALALAGGSYAQDDTAKKKVKAYMVSDAHLDTQWNWDIQTTINEYVWNTISQNLFLLKKYPEYVFNFEGGVKYAWMKEYYPEQYEEMKKFIEEGRWHIAGSSWEASDVLVPSVEASIRNIMLGQTYYRQEFGKEGTDIFLPDCFGFGWTLPTIAAHCGLIGFSSQKLDWRNHPFYGKSKHPFTIGLWKGIDGKQVMLAHGYDYGRKWNNEDLSKNKDLEKLAQRTPLNTVYRYYGTGDIGGSPTLGSVRSVEQGIKGDGPVEVISATSDQLFKDYLPFNNHPELPVFDGELLMDVHGTGCYTSQAAMKLYRQNVPVLGTSPLSIDRAENRHKFSAMLDTLGIDQPRWAELTSMEEIDAFIAKVGFPILIRPSYVLPGAAMNVCHSKEQMIEFLNLAAKVSKEYPVVVSEFLQGAKEIEFDAVAMNGEVVEYAISEHIEFAGVHSGDATLVFPAQKIYFETARRIKKVSKMIAKELNISGPFNIQFLAKNNDVKVIECNLRASRSFPFVSKVLKRNFIETATRIMLDAPYTKPDKSAFDIDWIGVKASQFSFARLHKADPVLGVDMSSTGEVGCIGDDFNEALLSAMIAVGNRIPQKNVLVSSGAAKSKAELLEPCHMLAAKGYNIYGTAGTAKFLNENGISATAVCWPDEQGDLNIMDMFSKHVFELVVNIPKDHSKRELTNGYKIRRAAIDHNIPLITNARLASAFISAFCNMDEKDIQIKSWQEYK